MFYHAIRSKIVTYSYHQPDTQQLIFKAKTFQQNLINKPPLKKPQSIYIYYLY